MWFKDFPRHARLWLDMCMMRRSGRAEAEVALLWLFLQYWYQASLEGWFWKGSGSLLDKYVRSRACTVKFGEVVDKKLENKFRRLWWKKDDADDIRWWWWYSGFLTSQGERWWMHVPWLSFVPSAAHRGRSEGKIWDGWMREIYYIRCFHGKEGRSEHGVPGKQDQKKKKHVVRQAVK